MPYYLLQGTYSKEAMAGRCLQPRSYEGAIRAVVENLGGKLEGAWLSFGDSYVVAVINMPNRACAASVSLAAAAGGVLSSAMTTPLLGFAKGVVALRKVAAGCARRSN